MKNRHFIFYSIILAALVVAYILELQSSRVTQMETGYVKIFPAFNTGEVLAIRAYKLSPEGSELRLVKKGDAWDVASRYNVRADQDRVGSLLKDMGSLKGEVRTKTEDKLPTFWLQDKEAVHIELLDGENKPIVHLLFGKKGETGETAFVRKAGDSTVYSAPIRLNSLFQIWYKEDRIDQLRWCDLRLKDIKDWNAIDGCEVFLPDGARAAFKKIRETNNPDGKPKDVWIMSEPAERTDIPAQEISNVVASLAYLRGEDVLDPAKMQEYGLESTPYRAIMQFENGTSYELRLASLPDGQYAAALKDGAMAFRVGQPVFERTFGKVKGLLQSPPRPPAEVPSQS